jgi:hypothetical protein
MCSSCMFLLPRPPLFAPPQEKEAVAAALFSIQPGSAAALAANYARWRLPDAPTVVQQVRASIKVYINHRYSDTLFYRSN